MKSIPRGMEKRETKFRMDNICEREEKNSFVFKKDFGRNEKQINKINKLNKFLIKCNSKLIHITKTVLMSLINNHVPFDCIFECLPNHYLQFLVVL